MSEFTFATLVRSSNQNQLANFLNTLKTETYLFPANEAWFAVVVEDDMRKRSELAQLLSKQLETASIYLENCEDHGWSYTFFDKGEKQGYLEINYEQVSKSQKANANSQALRAVAINQQEFWKFELWLRKVPANILEGIQYFKDAFHFEKIAWVSYDYFSTMSESELESLGATSFPTKTKRYQVKQVILDELEAPLRERGYLYQPDKKFGVYQGEYVFLKEIDGFEYGLVISNYERNVVEPRIYSPMIRGADIYRVIERDIRPPLRFSTEQELRSCLRQIVDYFLQKGVKWLTEHIVTRFQANEIYDELVDPYLEQLHFKRDLTTEDVFRGGEISYVHKDTQIIFRHFEQFTTLKVLIMEGEEEVALVAFLHQNRNKLNLDLTNTKMWFQDKEDFTDMMKQVLDYLALYFKHRDTH